MKSLGILTGFALAFPVTILAMVIWWEFTLAVVLVAAAAGLTVRLTT